MSTKEQYWKYSLITIILVMGVVIFFKAFRRTAGGSDHLYPASQSDALSDRKETYEKKPDGYPHVNRDYSDFSDSDISGRLAFNQ